MVSIQQNNLPRLIGFGIAVLLHIMIIWGLKAGLARTLAQAILNPLETTLIEEEIVEEVKPPPLPPELPPPPTPWAPMPVFAIDVPSDTSTAIRQVTDKPRPPAPPPPKAQPVIVLPTSDGKRGITQPAYPPTSRRLEEQGSVELKLNVLPDGKVGACDVRSSSGFPRLDEAACKEALRRWKLKPGTVDGKPTAMEFPIKVTFIIEEAR